MLFSVNLFAMRTPSRAHELAVRIRARIYLRLTTSGYSGDVVRSGM